MTLASWNKDLLMKPVSEGDWLVETSLSDPARSTRVIVKDLEQKLESHSSMNFNYLNGYDAKESVGTRGSLVMFALAILSLLFSFFQDFDGFFKRCYGLFGGAWHFAAPFGILDDLDLLVIWLVIEQISQFFVVDLQVADFQSAILVSAKSEKLSQDAGDDAGCFFDA